MDDRSAPPRLFTQASTPATAQPSGWRRRDAMGALLALGVGGGLAACGGGEDLSKAQVRLLNASIGYDALDLVVDGSRVRTAVGYGNASSYAEVDPSAADTDITRNGSSAALYSLTPSVNEGDHYTLVAYGDDGALSATLLTEETSEPDSGLARLRVLNGAAAAGTLDVYVTDETTALSDAAPLHAAVAVGTPSAFDSVDAGTWRLRVTAAGDPNDLRLDVSGLALASRQIATLVLVAGEGGVLVDAMLLGQQGGLVSLAGTQARVRAVAAVPGAAVTAAVNGVALISGVTAPAIGLYLLVPAGETTVSVTVGGTTIDVDSTLLTAGTDHTLLVWGPASAPQVAWLADDNRPPQVSTHTALRLVHAVAGLDGALSLTVDLTPRAEAVAPGTASTRSTFSGTSDASLAVTAEGLGSPIYEDTEKVLLAGKVYTLFMLGSASAPLAALRTDR